YWNAPYSTCTPERDSVDWKRLLMPVDAGSDQLMPIGSTITLKGKSSARRVVWQTNGYGRFLDSSAKSTLYYPDTLDFPLCTMNFYLKELEQFCELQTDSLQVEWLEEGISIKGLSYEACFMDSIEIILEGNSDLSLNWESNGSGNFYYDSLLGRWIYLPSDEDFLLDQIKIKVTAIGYCFQELDSVVVPISDRDRWKTQAHFKGPITVYPNPTTDWLTIDGSCPVDVVSVKVYDMLGRQIQKWQIQELPFVLSIESLATGVYILHVELANGRIVIIPVAKYGE
ncbi:MAG: T9SS type A sorting domain-containing protein, partial [Bacteroidia bacterium]